MAIFKRCVAFLVLGHRVALRLPRERINKETFVYDEDGIADNIIPDPEHKQYYDKVREGKSEKYEDYREAKQEEDEWANEFLTRTLCGQQVSCGEKPTHRKRHRQRQKGIAKITRKHWKSIDLDRKA